MGWLDPLAIYVIIALVGAGRAFEIPTMVAIIPALVPRPVVPSATAWFASSNQLGVIVGPILGGLLYDLGPATVYGLAVAFWCHRRELHLPDPHGEACRARASR